MTVLLIALHLFLGKPDSPETAVKSPSVYEGIAMDAKTGLPLYKEEHEEISENGICIGLRTVFRDVHNNVIAKRTVSFRDNETIPNFQMEDERDGYLEGARVSGDSVHLFWRKNHKSTLNETTVLIPEPAVVDAGFNNFVKLHWDELLEGSTLEFNFGAAFALDYYRFRIFKKSGTIVDGRERVVMQCDIDNFLVRLFVKPIVLTYDVETRRLVEYEGISNINDDRGKSHFVRIQYNPFGP